MEKIRLQKFLADAGVASRRAAEVEIEKGNVSVNGHVATVGMKINPKEDIISYKGKKNSLLKTRVHLHNDEQAPRIPLQHHR